MLLSDDGGKSVSVDPNQWCELLGTKKMSSPMPWWNNKKVQGEKHLYNIGSDKKWLLLSMQVKGLFIGHAGSFEYASSS